jgi:acetyltransferase-like isoleucine patch superfamily enzyme/dTDP-4-dehydrorhamnose 3,5-epimerase-like enzyme
MNHFIHPNGICESKNIGEKTKIWAFAHVLPQASIGKNCNICDHVFIENDVIIGDNVTIKCGVQIWDGITIEDNVFIGPNVAFTNDKFPRSKQYPEEFCKTKIEKGASLGANSTILPGVTIGQNAMVGAGSVVTHSVPANAIVVGNPATIQGYVNSVKNHEDELSVQASPEQTCSIKGVKIFHNNIFKDMRGSLIAGEFNKDLPFIPKRFFMVFDVPSQKIRGEHAHKKCHQFLVCVHGSITVVVDDGSQREEILLNKPNIGVHIPPMIWGTEYKYSSDAVLLCFASENYDNSDYIRSYGDYLILLKK